MIAQNAKCGSGFAIIVGDRDFRMNILIVITFGRAPNKPAFLESLHSQSFIIVGYGAIGTVKSTPSLLGKIILQKGGDKGRCW